MAENPRIEELRRRVLADPASIAFAALAEEFRRVGRYEEAVETCRTGLQRHPAYLSARVTLGRALIETGDFAGAREQLETVLRSAPENLAAIRGLAQIEEHLGHSTEMDPQLADMMNTMHVESLRAAAERVPVISQPPPVESAPPVQPAPPVEPPPPQMALSPPSDAPISTKRVVADRDSSAPVDLFAGFAPASSARAPAQDLTFDLSDALSDKRITEQPAAAPIDVSMGPPALERVPEPVVERRVQVERRAEFPGVEPALEVEHELAVEAGPDPEVLATLARLERFLGAIHSLRA